MAKLDAAHREGIQAYVATLDGEDQERLREAFEIPSAG